mmetsp:Transcript_66735/g.130872  ORF Transcript_66735/g.130872 Transcript_66735/m.130872 type:complete len:452 (+) Transcript_66735:487-1842(+)
MKKTAGHRLRSQWPRGRSRTLRRGCCAPRPSSSTLPTCFTKAAPPAPHALSQCPTRSSRLSSTGGSLAASRRMFRQPRVARNLGPHPEGQSDICRGSARPPRGCRLLQRCAHGALAHRGNALIALAHLDEALVEHMHAARLDPSGCFNALCTTGNSLYNRRQARTQQPARGGSLEAVPALRAAVVTGVYVARPGVCGSLRRVLVRLRGRATPEPVGAAGGPRLGGPHPAGRQAPGGAAPQAPAHQCGLHRGAPWGQRGRQQRALGAAALSEASAQQSRLLRRPRKARQVQRLPGRVLLLPAAPASALGGRRAQARVRGAAGGEEPALDQEPPGGVREAPRRPGGGWQPAPALGPYNLSVRTGPPPTAVDSERLPGTLDAHGKDTHGGGFTHARKRSRRGRPEARAGSGAGLSAFFFFKRQRCPQHSDALALLKLQAFGPAATRLGCRRWWA